MKTKLFLFASLIPAGLLFRSCQKDNDLEAISRADTEMPFASSKTGEHNDGDLTGKDLIFNSPDPFQDKTTIEYRVPFPAWVTIVVTNRKEQFFIRLVSEFQHEGIYRVDFDAKELPPGQYVAELKIGDLVVGEIMTKKLNVSTGRTHKDL